MERTIPVLSPRGAPPLQPLPPRGFPSEPVPSDVAQPPPERVTDPVAATGA